MNKNKNEGEFPLQVLIWQGRPVGVYTDASCSSEQQQNNHIWEKVWNCTLHRAGGNDLLLEY